MFALPFMKEVYELRYVHAMYDHRKEFLHTNNNKNKKLSSISLSGMLTNILLDGSINMRLNSKHFYFHQQQRQKIKFALNNPKSIDQQHHPDRPQKKIKQKSHRVN